MQDHVAENASLRLLCRHYATGAISLVDYRVARHSLLQALESGSEVPEMPVFEELPEEPVQATIRQTPFAESGEWAADATAMVAALPANAGNEAAETVAPADKADTPAVAAVSSSRTGMDANSWVLLVVILVLLGVGGVGALIYVFKL